MEGRRFDEVRIELHRGIVSIPWSSCEALLDQFRTRDPTKVGDREQPRAGRPPSRLREDDRWTEPVASLAACLGQGRPARLPREPRARCGSLPDRLVRGVSASALVFDEASHFVSESWGPRTLERIWQAARPLLTIYGEQGRTLGISTPSDGQDFYGQLYVQAETPTFTGRSPKAAITAAC